MSVDVNVARLLAGMATARAQWLELEPGLSVRVLRPTESVMLTTVIRRVDDAYQLEVTTQHVKDSVDNWKGFTEATLVGAAGATEELPFHRDLWAAKVDDSAKWDKLVQAKLIDMVKTWLGEKDDAAKK